MLACSVRQASGLRREPKSHAGSSFTTVGNNFTEVGFDLYCLVERLAPPPGDDAYVEVPSAGP
jgi:hypothetical protein